MFSHNNENMLFSATDNNNNSINNNNDDGNIPQSGFSLFDSFHQDITGYLGNRYNKDTKYNQDDEGYYLKDGALDSRASVETQDSSSTRYRKRLPLRHQPKTIYDENAEYNNYNNNFNNFNNNNNFNNHYFNNLKSLNNQTTQQCGPFIVASSRDKRRLLHCLLVPILAILVVVISFIIYTELYDNEAHKEAIENDPALRDDN